MEVDLLSLQRKMSASVCISLLCSLVAWSRSETGDREHRGVLLQDRELSEETDRDSVSVSVFCLVHRKLLWTIQSTS